jgi:hypothetical protein
VSRKFAGILLLAALAMGALGQRADATLYSLPKSLKASPLDGVEMNLSIWGPSAKSFFLHRVSRRLSAAAAQKSRVVQHAEIAEAATRPRSRR